MSKKRKIHSPEYKAKIALEALQEARTVSEIASRHQLHPTQISQWKKAAKDRLPEIFSKAKKSPAQTEEELTAPLFEQIGRLQVELDWLKKKAAIFSDE